MTTSTLLAPLLLALLAIADEAPVVVEPPDLTRRPDLIGRDVVVDGRVRLFQLHRGRGFDEILLRESDAIFRLPPRLVYRDAPRQRVAKIRGKLRKEGRLFVVDVESVQLLPDDEDRLARGLASLAPGDLETQLAWARWAARRAELYQDKELADKARELQIEAIRSEAGEPEAERPTVALKLARRARQLGHAEPLAAALAHRAFATRAGEPLTPQGLEALIAEVSEFLPDSRQPQPGDIGRWQAAYENDPYATYLKAPESARKALDRRLLADLRERRLRERASANPATALSLAAEARSELPDRPKVARDLRITGLKTASEDVTKLRRGEILELANNYDKIGQPDAGRDLIRTWLLDRREKLSGKRVIDERIQLAEDFLELDKDRDSAIELLHEAAAIDPESKAVSAAFRRLGYRREGDEWVKAIPGQSSETDPDRDEESAAVRDDPLIGLTPEEVTARLGKPDRKSQSITQARGMIQWVYLGAGNSTQYIYFEKRPGYPPQVVVRYTPH